MDFEAFYAQLKKGAIQKLYLFEGEEEYAKESALAALRKALVSGPLALMNENILQNPDETQLIAACETLPVMAERRLVIVKESAWLTGKGRGDSEEGEGNTAREDKGLMAYFDRLPDSLCLVFFVRGKANARKRLYKKAQELRGVVSFDPLDQGRLMRWVVREFADYNKKIDRNTAEQLIFACGKELLTLKNEVGKLAALLGERELVTLKDINSVATLSTEYRVFDLADKVAAGQAKEALPLLAAMLKGGEQRLMLLALLQRQYRQLLFARILKEDGKTPPVIARTLGVPDFAVRRLLQTAGPYPLSVLKAAYLRCLNQEYLIKSGRISEEGSLEQLVFELIRTRQEVARAN